MVGGWFQFLTREALAMVGGLRAVKVGEWTARLARFRNFDGPAVRFCEAEGVSTAAFYQWRRKLRERPAGGGGATSAADGGNDGPRQAAFRAVSVTASAGVFAATSPAVTVSLPGGIVVHVADNPRAIETVLRAVTGRPASGGDHEIHDERSPSGASAC
jgi:hypothetical protein